MFTSLVPLEGSVTANQYKSLRTDHLYPMIKHFCSILMGVVSSRGTPPLITGHNGSLNDLMRMKVMYLICCDINVCCHTHQISA